MCQIFVAFSEYLNFRNIYLVGDKWIAGGDCSRPPGLKVMVCICKRSSSTELPLSIK